MTGRAMLLAMTAEGVTLLAVTAGKACPLAPSCSPPFAVIASRRRSNPEAARSYLRCAGPWVASSLRPSQRRERGAAVLVRTARGATGELRSEEQTSELQSLMRISHADYCLKQ